MWTCLSISYALSAGSMTFVLTTSHTHLAVVKIGSSFTQAGTDSCLTGNLMVSSFDLKNIAKTQLEDRNFYNEVRERELLVSMLFSSHGKRTETTTSNILKVSLLSDQVRSNLPTPKLTIQTASQVFES